MFYFALFFVCFSSALFASWVGNPADPCVLGEGLWIKDTSFSSLRVGVNGDYLLTKRMRPARVSQKAGVSGAELSWRLISCDISWNIKERFSLGILVGSASAANVLWRQNSTFYQAPGRSGLFWGADAKLILLEMKETSLGVDARIAEIRNVEGVLLANGRAVSGEFSSRLYFWQVGVGLSQDLGFLKPYAGAVVERLTARIRAPECGSLRLRDLLLIGTYEGCSVTLGSKMFLNIEARQFFESGLSLSGELRF